MKILLIILFLILNLYANQKSFKVSYDVNYAPFSYKQDNIERGLLIDIWKLWASYNNYKIEFVPSDLWDEAINLAKEEKVDFFLGTNAYEDWMMASDSFYEAKISFFANSKNKINLNKKSNLKIGIIGSDYNNLILEEFPNMEVFIFDDYKEAIYSLTKNQIDLLFDDKLSIEYYVVQNNQFHLIKEVENFLYKENTQAISSSKEKIEIFNNGFLKIPISELIELEKKWILDKSDQYYPKFKQDFQLSQEEKEFIKNNKIKISISNSWEPFSFKSSDNEASGISAEYWNIIAKKLNLDYENIFFETFDDQLKSIKKKKSDLIYSTGETSQKKDYALFTKEYIKYPISIVTKKDENFIENISILKDKTIAVGKNFTVHNILKNEFPKINFLLVSSVKEGLEAVSNKKAYAFIDIQPVLLFNIAKYDFDDLKVSGNTGLDFSLKFMIRNDYKILESILNKAISSVSSNELSLITNKWNNIYFQTKFNFKLFFIVISIIVLILFIFIFRNLVLHNNNKKLKIKVDEKTKELNEINKNLEELVEKKSQELIQKENILNHQSKMASMGEMIENIAHQWRQPLSIISTVATGTRLKKELDILNDKEFYEAIDIINNSSQYLSNTIDDFRNFFSTDKERSSFKINISINKVLSLLKSKLKNKDISIIYEEKDIFISGYENEFMQVILNILNNAIDAFENNTILEKYIFINIIEKEDTVLLVIKDNAGGIKEDIINRIFEPYFTTKHKSQGTGIGLYMSLEIIKKHMLGNISAINTKYYYKNLSYSGAQFEIEIPIN